MVYDFAVIGAGVSGAWTAFALSAFRNSVCLLEQGGDVCSGASRANSAVVHAGYDPKPGTLLAKLNVRGNEIIRNVAQKMDIPFKQIGSYVLAFSEEDMDTLRALKERGDANGVPDLKLLTAEDVRNAEPNVSEDVRGALLAETAGIVSPFELCLAAAELAVENGAELFRSFRVTEIRKTGKIRTVVAEDGRQIEARTVINAAGCEADRIAAMVSDTSFSIHPRRGEYCLLDSGKGALVNRVLFQTPSKFGKGILALPTVDGNLLVGPTAEDVDDETRTETTSEGMAKAFRGAQRSVPCISPRDTITAFSGMRPMSSTGDFILRFSDADPQMFHIAGIESPGLTSAPAIAEYAVQQFLAQGLLAERKTDFIENRTVFRLHRLTDEERDAAIRENPLYGRIICRCETISEGEIVDAICRPAGARDVDGVKRRVRAGMGRCQGGFCGPRVLEIMARELDIAPNRVTKCGGESCFVYGETKGE